jgi:uncharacterized C2H2 Zn-finger protein
MVLRCPRCSELRFFGRTQVLGELVVCPRCETVFGWREAGALQPPHDVSAVKPDDTNETEA